VRSTITRSGRQFLARESALADPSKPLGGQLLAGMARGSGAAQRRRRPTVTFGGFGMSGAGRVCWGALLQPRRGSRGQAGQVLRPTVSSGVVVIDSSSVAH